MVTRRVLLSGLASLSAGTVLAGCTGTSSGATRVAPETPGATPRAEPSINTPTAQVTPTVSVVTSQPTPAKVASNGVFEPFHVTRDGGGFRVSPPVAIEVVEWAGGNLPSRRVYGQIGDRLAEQVPGVSVKLTEMASLDDLTAQVKRLAQEGAPEVMADAVLGTDSVEIGKHVEAGDLYDLTEALRKPSYDSPGKTWLETVQPGLAPLLAYRGKCFTIPHNVALELLVVNRALFERNNLALPQTWTELIDSARTLKAKGITPIGGVGNLLAAGIVNQVALRLLGFEGAVPAVYGTAGFMESGWLSVAERCSELKEYLLSGFIGADWGSVSQQYYVGGKIAMMPATVGTLTPPSQAGVFSEWVQPFPRIDGGKGDRAELFGTLNVYTVAKRSANPGLGVDWVRVFSSVKLQEVIVSELGLLSPFVGVKAPSYPPAAEVHRLFSSASRMVPLGFGLSATYTELNDRFRRLSGELLTGQTTPRNWVNDLDSAWSAYFRDRPRPSTDWVTSLKRS